jgi:UbiD family decarboxylase
MSLRDYIQHSISENKIKVIKKPVSKTYEVSGILKKLEPDPVIFQHVSPTAFQVIGNLFCSKNDFARYFGVNPSQIIPLMLSAIENPSPPKIVETAPCQEVINFHPNLDELPILRHCDKDGGNYISSGVMVSYHPNWGQNLDFHRLMQFSKTEMAVRVVPNRHFHTFLHNKGEIDVAVCIGNPPNVLAAAATSVELGFDELTIANSLEPINVVKAKTVPVYIPAESEFVLEGTIYQNKLHPEGPFVDLTETYDIVRNEPVFVVKAITHRKDAIWHALLPGALEHKLLMGMPREPTIYNSVNKIVNCLDVHVNPGGCSWLHAIVKIQKQAESDGKKAIEAAFAGHRSCKHVYVVDEDIDIYNPLDVEWAMATRFQADRDLAIFSKELGSSLDPSSDPGSHLTTKVGFDLTKPLQTAGKEFNKAEFPDIDLTQFING